MARGAPILRVPSVGLPITGHDAAGFSSALRGIPILDGRVVSVTFVAENYQTVKHGLKRRYVGAMVISQSAQHTQSISAIDPGTYESGGGDATVSLSVTAGSFGGATYSGTVYLWVF